MKKLTTLFVLLFTAFNMLAANITLYFVDESGWGNIHAYAWKNSTQVNLGDWPGNPATLESKTKGGKNVYSYTFESTAADRIIFNNGGNGKQTGDLTVNTSKPYYYSSTWNSETQRIEIPLMNDMVKQAVKTQNQPTNTHFLIHGQKMELTTGTPQLANTQQK